MNAKALYKINYGIYVLSSKLGEKLNAQISNTIFQVTSEPKRLALSVNKQNLTHEFIDKSMVVGISVLSKKTPLEFIGRFGFRSGRDFDKFEGINYRIGITGAPIVLDNTVAFIEGKVVDSFDVGTHTLFIVEVVESEVLNEEEPMTYEYYHNVKQGSAPKTAPTYIDDKKDTKTKSKYVCKVCGYVYDPEKGDATQGIKPNTSFKDLPENWKCPVCGVSKEYFQEIK
jgi:rubredoxin/flavin reductase (DIM6/NTAB) family NADH-FMN oxidoreductase RutF